jgi:O-antigen/teichoic acid export membrane protein
MKNLLKIWLTIPVGLVIMVLLSSWFYDFWIGDKVVVPDMLSIAMAIYVLFFTFNMIFNFFINGVGKIRIQMVLSIASIFINIPLSIIFVKFFDLGLSGVIIATTISVAASAVLYPIQYVKIINSKAKGIWNK